MTVRLFLFGSPTVEYGGESFALPFERRTQLLVFLALKRSWVGRAELATMLWPDQENKLAYTNLRKTLFRLQSLRWARSVESQGGALRFEAETDVFAFESALREQRIADALSMRRGELLVAFDDDQSEAWSSWLNFERDRLRLAWRDAALSRLTADIDPAEGIDLSKRLLDADPLDEAALRAHMSWLARSGQSARARQAYQEFVERLAEDLGLTPGAELRALHASLGMPMSPPTSAAPTASVKLDADFIGRTVELRRIAALLAQEGCRLLCLIGPGGVGKTRLAHRAMHEFAPGFSDGAAFVPLEDITSPNELGGRIARELGLHLTGSHEPLDQVIEFLRERQMLLVLDNFEQLAAGASILEKLLQACTRVEILVTSRVRLGVSMEWLLPLEGLPCPEAEDQDRFEAFDAVRLFVQAAQRVEPALVPTVEAAAIVDICQQLGGLPLALELAAAWTRVLSCDAIASELRHGTELLRVADAAHPTRHASIDVVFDQSWRLLSETERDALSRLSVFHGGFSADAARSVAGASLPVLGALADKSLLRKDEARISMHPLVQQFAALRLGDDGARELTERAHALHFHRLLTQLRPAVDNADREALQQLDIEFENCRVAWHWATRHSSSNMLSQSVQTLTQYCDFRSRLDEGLALLHDALDSGCAADPHLGALLLAKVAHLEYRLDRYVDAEATATRALEAARGADAHDALVQSLKVLGTCYLRLGRYNEARRYFKQALQQAPARTDPRNAASMLSNLALVEKVMGHYDEALRLSIRALTEQRKVGDVAGEALSLNNLASLHLERKEFAPAGEYLKPALALCDRHGLSMTRGLVLANLTGVAMNTGDYDQAEACARRAIEHAQAIGNRYLVSFLKLQFVRLALRRNDLIAARADLSASLELALAVGRPALLVEGVTCFAEILVAQGEPACACSVAAFAADHPGTGAPERDELLKAMAQWSSKEAAPAPWPDLELDELVHRIIVESNIAYAPLIAALRGAPVHVTH